MGALILNWKGSSVAERYKARENLRKTVVFPASPLVEGSRSKRCDEGPPGYYQTYQLQSSERIYYEWNGRKLVRVRTR